VSTLTQTLRRLAVLAVGAASCTVGSATQTHAAFTVGARVLATATLQVNSEPAEVVISAEDVSRGYVEIQEPTRVQVSSNSPAGYALVLLPQSSWFSGVTVRCADEEITMGADGGAIVERRHAGASSLELNFRFALASELTPGHYPWPLHLLVRPLETP
jgi:hypothetical protein